MKIIEKTEKDLTSQPVSNEQIGNFATPNNAFISPAGAGDSIAFQTPKASIYVEFKAPDPNLQAD